MINFIDKQSLEIRLLYFLFVVIVIEYDRLIAFQVQDDTNGTNSFFGPIPFSFLYPRPVKCTKNCNSFVLQKLIGRFVRYPYTVD